MELRDIEYILQDSTDPPPLGFHSDSDVANSSTLDGAVITEDNVNQGCEVCEVGKPPTV
jgi:hypothetical protein